MISNYIAYTVPYLLIALFRSQYNAEPADIWSCGIVLVAMLTGELPWDKPTADQVTFPHFLLLYLLLIRYGTVPYDHSWRIRCQRIFYRFRTSILSVQLDYMNWKDLKYGMDPWRKIGNLPLSLLRRILVPHPSRRYKLDQIQVFFNSLR